MIVCAIPPTATFKGEYDAVGNLDKNIIRDELDRQRDISFLRETMQVYCYVTW
jgi:hypothetical protein